MKRRAFLTGAAALIASPRAAEAQPAAKRYRVAYVGIAPRTVAEVAQGPPYKAFVTELQRLGYVEGHNVVIELWTAAGRIENYAALAREVAQSQPDVIVAPSTRDLDVLAEKLTQWMAARLFAVQGDAKAELAAADRAVDRDPRSHAARRERARAHLRTGDFDAAIPDLGDQLRGHQHDYEARALEAQEAHRRR